MVVYGHEPFPLCDGLAVAGKGALIDRQHLVVVDLPGVVDEQARLLHRILRELRKIGLGDAEAFGAVCEVGYFPDSFGNMGQAPQLLRQAWDYLERRVDG